MEKNTAYNEKIILKIIKKLEVELKPHRFVHSLGVSYIATALAMKYGEDIYKAQIAGLLHDCAKSYSDSELIKLCQKNKLDISECELKHGFLLHAKYGAYLANKKYDIDDEDILNSIKWHTTGREDMSLLEKIIFVADYIEPTRDKAKNLDEIRNLAFNFDSIDNALLKIMEDTILYLNDSANDLDETTLKAYNYYKRMVS